MAVSGRKWSGAEDSERVLNGSALKRAIGGALAGSAVLLLAACAAPSPKFSMQSPVSESKEYFSEKEYGVKASPRVVTRSSRLTRGGGRYQVGKPYQIKGKWYRPKEDPDYSKRGKASWYGAAFDGRLTANGEVYDMSHLTAAHPTMPLPSYARVTNLANGASVVVRVNDRGPYAHGRIIDLSKRAADMLGYSQNGVAEVQVDYVGKAPLHGQDDEYLLASYKPGKGMPSYGLPDGVMLAMNGPAPSVVVQPRVPAQGLSGISVNPDTAVSSREALPELPNIGPLIVNRPLVALALGYAPDSPAPSAVSAFDKLGIDADRIKASWRMQTGGETRSQTVYVAAGTFASRDFAEALADRLSRHARSEVSTTREGSRTWYSVAAYPSHEADLDTLLRTAWENGALDALVVRP